MALRRLICFKHSTPLGDAPAHRLFEAVTARRRDLTRPSREFTDYEISVDRTKIPTGIEVVEPAA
jgi:CRISPR-associated protein Csd2